MDAAERPRTRFPVRGVIELSAFREEPLGRNAVVTSQHLKMSRQVHSHELPSNHARREAQDLRHAIDARASDYVMLDAMKIGALRDGWRAASLAEVHGGI